MSGAEEAFVSLFSKREKEFVSEAEPARVLESVPPPTRPEPRSLEAPVIALAQAQPAARTTIESSIKIKGEAIKAIGKYEALGASVIGVSGDDLELITRFSVQVCQGKFPVAADEKKAVIKAFDAAMQTRPEYANRVSYVIAPNGKVVYTYLSLNPNKHVEKTLGALAEWAKDKAKDNPRLR